MSVFKTTYPNARPLTPAIKGRSGIPTVAWRKLFGSQRLIVSMPKTLAAEMGFNFSAGARNYAECAYLSAEGKLLIANVTGRTDSTDRWTVQNRQSTMTLTMKLDWVPAGTPDHRAQGCVFTVKLFQAGSVLELDLPDWAAPERVKLQAARDRGAAAADLAIKKTQHVPGFSMLSQKVA